MSEIWQIQLVEITLSDKHEDHEQRISSILSKYSEIYSIKCRNVFYYESLSFLAGVALLYSNQYCWDRLFSHHSNCPSHFYQQYYSRGTGHPRQYNSPRQGKKQSQC